MQVELINTGTELLFGQITNTHVTFMARRLAEVGLTLQRQITVPDGITIREAIAEALQRSDLIFVTGGLGPTSDDITRDVVAELLGKKLHYDETIFKKIEARFERRKSLMSELVKTQAMVPEGAEVLVNDYGTAPGLYLKTESAKHLFLLPGPPRELIPMVDEHVMSRLRKIAEETGAQLHYAILRTVGIGEAPAQDRIEYKVRVACPTVEIGYCARPGEVDIRLISKSSLEEVQQAQRIVQNELAEFVYSEGYETLEEMVIRLATQKKQTLAVAESCTGGLIAHRLTNVPGSSAVFLGGAVAYANEEKIRQLGVSDELLKKQGAVSPEVAQAMATGLRQRTGANLVVTTTGIAGPGGGTSEKPVGLCYLGFETANESKVLEKHLAIDRDAFKYMASQHALDLLRRGLLNM